MNAIAIIPARGGSKGIPQKNLIDFCGKPLVAWSILQARHAQTVKEVYVSSNDQHILDVAFQYGAIPIVRPEEFSTDISASEAALLHALTEIERLTQQVPPVIIFLQATSPLREPADIDGAVEELLNTQADSLFSMAVIDDFCIWQRQGDVLQGVSFDPFKRGRRQDRAPLYLENGSIYVFRPEILRKHHNRLGGKIAMFEMPYWKSYEIDTIENVEVCAYYFERKLLHRWQETHVIQTIPVTEIDLIVYDFDGVMTDNRVLVLQDGTEGVSVNRADGLGVNRFRARGIPQLILSTETNPVVQARAAKLGLEVIGACQDKAAALRNYCIQNGHNLRKVVYVGNDLNDLEAMTLAGWTVAPYDAHPAIKSIAKLVTMAKGGEGVIRELAERVIF